ncbi:MAG: alpha-L-fucosidase [Cyclobacteriaceae bacterium]|nr:alpha-L-fucosidase [Cyclobacteriaceae bacterium]
MKKFAHALPKAICITLVFMVFSLHLIAQKQTNPRAQWFVDERFGMFIHWGVYSGAEGYWKGEKHRDDNDYAEWIFYRNRIEKDEYLTLLERFDWAAIDPEQWVILAKKSGMKYVTLTAKHHDGFALWDSQVSEYDLGNFTRPKRDIVKELSIACQKHGLKLGLYYSHWVDWEHEYGWDHTKEIYPITADQYDIYWQEKVIPQMRELLTNYGPIGLMWFDMWINHSESIVTKAQLEQLKALIRELQPDCLVNSRLGLSIEEDPDIDFRTLGDNQLGSHKLDYPWQSPATVAHSWGYHARDADWQSTTALLQALVGNVSLNGNYMLNIGPKSNGEVPFEIEQRMVQMGKWLHVNGEAIYGCGGFDLDKDLHDWGKITFKVLENGRAQLFLHVFRWPYHQGLTLTGVRGKPELVYALADKSKSPLGFTHDEVQTKINIPALPPDPYVSVIVLEYHQEPSIVSGLVAPTVDHGYSLTFKNRLSAAGQSLLVDKERRGTIPEHITIDGRYRSSWKIFVDAPKTLSIDASYSFEGQPSQSKIVLHAAAQTIDQLIVPNGQTVGEPKQDWHIPNFTAHRLGNIRFPKAGIYEISMDLETVKMDVLRFQWLWLAEAETE